MGIFEKFKIGLSKSSKNFSEGFKNLVISKKVDSKTLEHLENFLIDYEIIFLDDGSIDSSWSVIKNLCSSSKKTKGVQFLTNYGKSMALSEGFKLAKGKIVITMDADLQDDPKEIIPLYKMITENNYDIVSGWKKKRSFLCLPRVLAS